MFLLIQNEILKRYCNRTLYFLKFFTCMKTFKPRYVWIKANISTGFFFSEKSQIHFLAFFSDPPIALKISNRFPKHISSLFHANEAKISVSHDFQAWCFLLEVLKWDKGVGKWRKTFQDIFQIPSKYKTKKNSFSTSLLTFCFVFI